MNMPDKNFASFLKENAQEWSDTSEVVQRAIQSLIDYEKKFGTDSMIKFVKGVCIDEIKNAGADAKYAGALLELMSKMNAYFGDKSN